MLRIFILMKNMMRVLEKVHKSSVRNMLPIASERRNVFTFQRERFWLEIITSHSINNAL